MPLGYAGTIYKCNMSLLEDLGVQRTGAKTVLNKAAYAWAFLPAQHYQREEIFGKPW